MDLNSDICEDVYKISKDRQVTVETIDENEKTGMDFVCFTGNLGIEAELIHK